MCKKTETCRPTNKEDFENMQVRTGERVMDDLISRKWLMEIFENYPFDTEKDKNRVIHVVRDTAPSVEPERKTGKLIEEINKMDRLYFDMQDGEIRVLPYENVIRIIQRIEPERKTGKWTDDGYCPFCGYIQQWEDDNYCGNCGAYLRGEEE